MKLEYEDIFEPEDIHRMNTKEGFDRKLNKDDIELSRSVPVIVRYDYIDLEATDYHFKQPFSHKDTIGYFSRMKEFAGKSLDKLMSERDPKTKKSKYHFYRNEVLRGKLLDAVKRILPKADMTHQIIYHFSLYDTDEWADRENDTRNTRVYFMLGTYGHIYILFFDPYHELNPMERKKET